MNEQQQAAHSKLIVARNKVDTISERLADAKEELREADEAMHRAILADTASWYNTPGVLDS